jgi:hypothetical protein
MVELFTVIRSNGSKLAQVPWFVPIEQITDHNHVIKGKQTVEEIGIQISTRIIQAIQELKIRDTVNQVTSNGYNIENKENNAGIIIDPASLSDNLKGRFHQETNSKNNCYYFYQFYN